MYLRENELPQDAKLARKTTFERNGQSPLWLLQSLVQTDEFLLKHSGGNSPLDTAPPMDVRASETTSEELRALWDHISSVWSKFGSTDPYWSVLTDERFRSKNMTDEASIEAFYATGQGELLRLEAWFHRNGLELEPDTICGVRLRRWSPDSLAGQAIPARGGL